MPRRCFTIPLVAFNRSSTTEQIRRLSWGATRQVHHSRGTRRYSALSLPNEQGFVRDPFKIIFCGRDLFSCTVFKQVYDAKDVWDSIYIITNPDVKIGRRSSRLDVSPLKVVGESIGVPVYTIPEDKAAFKKWSPPFMHTDGSNSQDVSHLLITASFGRILPASLLGLFPSTQRLNVHPSLLPAYRGPAPIQRAIMAGERETGVCVIEMGEVSRKAGKPVDSGDVWAVERMHIPEDASFLYMQDALATSGGKLLVKVLRDILFGRAQSSPQEAVTSGTARAPFITAKDSTIDFASQTALDIVRLERAIGHQRSLTVAAALPDGQDGRGVAISGLRVATEPPVAESEYPGAAYYSRETRSLIIQCAKGTWLSVDKLQTQDRAVLAAREWWNGVKGMGWAKEGTLLLRFRV